MDFKCSWFIINQQKTEIKHVFYFEVMWELMDKKKRWCELKEFGESDFAKIEVHTTVNRTFGNWERERIFWYCHTWLQQYLVLPFNMFHHMSNNGRHYYVSTVCLVLETCARLRISNGLLIRETDIVQIHTILSNTTKAEVSVDVNFTVPILLITGR